MRNSFIVAWFTIKDTVRKKSFLISNIVILSLILFIFGMIKLLFGSYSLAPQENTVENEVVAESSNTLVENEIEEAEDEKTEPLTVLLIDSNNILAQNAVKFKDEKIKFIITKDISNEVIFEQIEKGNIYSGVRLYENNNLLSFDYIVNEINSDSSGAAEYISDLLNKCYIDKVLTDYNLDETIITKLQNEPSYILVSPEKESNFKSSYIIGMFVSFVLFFAIYLYGHSISASIASEKNSRVMETLVTSASPTHIILGKTLGMGLLGLAQMLCIGVVTVLAYNTFIPPGIDIISIYLSDIRIDAFSMFIIILYFILGYTIYAFLNAVTGATVSKAEDIQSANLPLSFITMISFYLSFFTFDASESKLSQIASIFPLSSPFSMPSKVLAGFSNTADIFASAITIIITTIILAFISIRLYSIAILHYGNRLKFKDLIKMLFKIK